MALTPIPTGTDTQVNTYTSGDQIYSSVTALNDGGFVVTWSSDGQDGSGYGIYGQRYAADGSPVGSEFRVNTYHLQRPDLSLRDGAQRRRLRGDVVVVGQDGSGYGIYGQRYAADGTPVGSEFRANTSTSTTRSFLRNGAQRRRLRGDVVVVRPGRQRLGHLRPALCGGRQPQWGTSSTPTRTPPSTRSIPP